MSIVSLLWALHCAKEIGKEAGRIILHSAMPTAATLLTSHIKQATTPDKLRASVGCAVFVFCAAGVSPWLQKRFPDLKLSEVGQLMNGILSAGVIYQAVEEAQT